MSGNMDVPLPSKINLLNKISLIKVGVIIHNVIITPTFTYYALFMTYFNKSLGFSYGSFRLSATASQVIEPR
jgi:hypothetical protein